LTESPKARDINSLRAVVIPVDGDRGASVFEPGQPFPSPWRQQPVSSALSVYEGAVFEEKLVSAARVDWYTMGFLRKLTVHAASVGPLLASGAAGKVTHDPGAVYQAALDSLLRQAPRPLLIRFSFAEAADVDIDVLWRLAVRLDASCLIGDENSRTVVQLQFPGAKAALATFLGTFPRKALLGYLRTVLQRPRGGRVSRSGDGDRHFTVLGFDTTLPSPSVSAPAGLRFAEVPREDVERRPARYGVTPYSGVAPRGGACVAGFLDGEMVYRMWLRFDDDTVQDALPADVRNAVLRPAVLISGCHTSVAHRGRNIYPAALNWVADRAREKGARQLLMFVNVENTPSLRAAAKAGFTKVMDVVLGGPAVKRVHE
jgi:hypothetical protein